MWDAHYNETDEPALVIPIQDAGLQTHLREAGAFHERDDIID